MRFKDELRHTAQNAAELASRSSVVDHDVFIAEFDARLHHDADGTGEGVFKTKGGKGATMHLDSFQRRLRAGQLQMVERFHRATGDRHFRADDINRQIKARYRCRFFGNQRKTRSALGGYRIRQCDRYEPSGALHGLLRVRHFTQDDAHIRLANPRTAQSQQNLILRRPRRQEDG